MNNIVKFNKKFLVDEKEVQYYYFFTYKINNEYVNLYNLQSEDFSKTKLFIQHCKDKYINNNRRNLYIYDENNIQYIIFDSNDKIINNTEINKIIVYIYGLYMYYYFWQKQFFFVQ